MKRLHWGSGVGVGNRPPSGKPECVTKACTWPLPKSDLGEVQAAVWPPVWASGFLWGGGEPGVASKLPKWTLGFEAISWTARARLIPSKDQPASWGVADTGLHPWRHRSRSKRPSQRVVHKLELSSDLPQRGAGAEREAHPGTAVLGCPLPPGAGTARTRNFPGAPPLSVVPLYPHPCTSTPSCKEWGRWWRWRRDGVADTATPRTRKRQGPAPHRG